MLESEPQFVLLDTCVFVAAGFNTASRDLRGLEDLIAHGTIAIVTTDIVVREVHDKIAQEVKAAHSLHEQFRKRSDVRILRSAEASRHVLAELSPHTVVAQLRADFDDFLRRTKALILPTANLPAGPALDDYFDKKPPFGEGEKRKEFPDAFSIAAARLWLKEHGDEHLVVVTADRGFADGVMGVERVEHANKLSTLLDEVHSHLQAKARFLKQEVIQRRQELMKWAGDVFTDRGFHVRERWEAEVIEARVEGLDITDDPEDLEIVKMEARSATIVTRVDVDFKADLRYGDESAASHDREDGVTYWNYIEETVSEKVEDIELEIQVSFEGFDPDRFAIESVDFPGLDSVDVETSADKRWRTME